MTETDAHAGGTLSEMAPTGTSIPMDAGKYDVLPSVPRADQKPGNPGFDAGGIGSSDLASAADNPTDIPRRNKDAGGATEIITGTGDQLPATVAGKNFSLSSGDPASKGNVRYAKHRKDKQSDFDRLASDGAEVDPAPGEEEETQDEIRDRKRA